MEAGEDARAFLFSPLPVRASPTSPTKGGGSSYRGLCGRRIKWAGRDVRDASGRGRPRSISNRRWRSVRVRAAIPKTARPTNLVPS